MLRTTNFLEIYTILLVACLVILAVAKLIFPKRFHDFTAIVFNFRYLKVYGRDQKFLDVFEGLLFANLIIGLSIFSLLSYKTFFILNTQNVSLLLLKIALGISIFMLIKVLIERLISSIFNLDFILKNYLFEKISYKNFLGLLLIPINAVLLYSISPTKTILIILGLALVLIQFIGIIFFFKKNLSLIKKHMFYFILYLCTLEISPYVILYKSFTTL
ncbi:DUF4271 domain-containing protein [Lacinutrix sp. 5H-3-7-4]|uniref:DUF4271 domain-containing protein n=1 Tax=Lacinutrix sp. (strain 5H-3-7-4) TaxID=983544 RepID=UPI00020A39B9|nr:DUF4271 domain-containing protein [Lacinutrix sp. 5H-3-7-4]AEH01127.1 membrane protein [Lacinutrix sp. 5H-3-7-4]